MKTGFLAIYRLTQAQIDAGEGNALQGGLIEVINSNGTLTGAVYMTMQEGVKPQSLTTSGEVADAIVAGSAPNWEPTTKVSINQIRIATVPIGDIQVGDILRSKTSRTTLATFDVTEASNWEEISVQTRVIDGLGSASQVFAGSANNDRVLDNKIGTTDIIANISAPTTTAEGYITLGDKQDTGKYASGAKVWRRTIKGYYPNQSNNVQNVNSVAKDTIIDLGTGGKIINFVGWISRIADQTHSINNMPSNGGHISAFYMGGTYVKLFNTCSVSEFDGKYFEASFDYISPVAWA